MLSPDQLRQIQEMFATGNRVVIYNDDDPTYNKTIGAIDNNGNMREYNFAEPAQWFVPSEEECQLVLDATHQPYID